jgi:conjugative relaxase-like TrwC/TraI family protein
VARSQEEYYTGAGEAPGYWLGQAAGELGLDGMVTEEGLHRILNGAHPLSGARLGAPPGGVRVAGYDLTFRAPKSVSLLYGLGGPQVAGAVREAHDQAVAEAVGYLERQAAIVSRGHARERQELASGVVAAAYRHRTSRAGDPLLHTHVLVGALGRGGDGRWTALDGRALYGHAKTAGYLYQAVLRGELTRRLGVQWGPVHRGTADIAGVPRAVVEVFSQRRAQIRRWLAETGGHSAKAAQVAALATRPVKERGVGEVTLRERWRDRAEAVGFSDRELARCLHRAEPATLSAGDVEQLQAWLASPDGLTRGVSTFTRRDAIRGLCQALATGGSAVEIERLADGFLDGNAQVRAVAARPRRGSGGLLPVDQRCYSTGELLAVEARVVAGGLGRRGEGAGVVPAAVLEEALRVHTQLIEQEARAGRVPWRLAGEQIALVQALVTSGDGVQLINAKAGSGKTSALRAARLAWEGAGYRVVGVALAARAAQELRAGAGIQASTIARLLGDLGNPGGQGWDARTVLVVDEAGMVGTRTLARLLDYAERAGTKVVLCGDVAQLPEIDAGGVFRALWRRLGGAELEHNRRQQQPWERQALDALRAGDAAAAIASYLAHGRVVICRRAGSLRDKLVADWWQAAHRSGEQPPIMLAARRVDVADLNARARTLMQGAGRLSGDPLRVGGREFAVGDRVLLLRNAYRLGVLNGTRAAVVTVDHEHGSLGIRTDEGCLVELPRWYVGAWGQCWVDHGYAMTATKAQGMTTDRAFVLGTDELYREWGYVAMSRARLETRLYVATGDDPEARDLDLRSSPPADPVAELARWLERSHAKHLALDQRSRTTIDPSPTDIRRLLRPIAAAAGAAPDRGPQPGRDLRGEPVGRAAGIEGDPPRYLLAELGGRPRSSAARALWRTAAARIQDYRNRYGVDDPKRPLGPEPAEPGQRADWQAVSETIAQAAARIDTYERGIDFDEL